MNKNQKTVVLSRWFTIDNLLFGDNDPKDVLGESDFKEYLISKASFLSGLAEMYTALDYNPSVMFKSSKDMRKFGINESINAKKRAREIVVTDYVSESIRTEIKESNLLESADAVAYMIDKKLKSIAFDVVMLESALSETGNKKSLNSFSGKLMLAAYKKFRDSLLRYAY